jgi:uncharacterized protein (DUF488 family)
MTAGATNVFTVGYQGRTIDEFANMLMTHGVTIVVDVRSRPISRIKGFSKTRLSAALESMGIKYQHVRDLGMPEQWMPLRSGKDGNQLVLNLYRGTMNEREGCVDRLEQLAESETICLLCFESNHRHCHRDILADSLKSRQLKIHHIGF